MIKKSFEVVKKTSLDLQKRGGGLFLLFRVVVGGVFVARSLHLTGATQDLRYWALPLITLLAMIILVGGYVVIRANRRPDGAPSAMTAEPAADAKPVTGDEPENHEPEPDAEFARDSGSDPAPEPDRSADEDPDRPGDGSQAGGRP